MLQRAESLAPCGWGVPRRSRRSRADEPSSGRVYPAEPFAGRSALRRTDVREGRATLTLPAGSSGTAPDAPIDRAALTLLVEAAATAAAFGDDPAPAGQEAAGELYVSFIRSAPEPPLNAEARVMSQAGQRRNCEVEVRDWNGELVAKGFLSCDV